MNADCIDDSGGKFQRPTPATELRRMGNNDKTVKVSDPLTRMLVGILGVCAIGFGGWFANEIQKNSVATSVLTQRVNTIESQFPAQMRELKIDIKSDLAEVKDMIRRLDKK